MTVSTLDEWDIILVSHNSGPAILSEWAEAGPDLKRRVICVENGDDPASLAIVQQLFPTVIQTANLGLSAANNTGFKSGSSRFVLFANPDLRCNLSDFEIFERALASAPGIVAPRLVDAAGRAQDSVRGWPSVPQQIMNRLLPERHPRVAAYRWPDTSDSFVPWVLGAAVATRRQDMDLIGGWPEEYFLYFEDTELCLRYWRAGLHVQVLESARWYHAWERASRSLRSPATRFHVRSAIQFYKSHPGMALGLVPPKLRPRSQS